jgi:hypothetical protein
MNGRERWRDRDCEGGQYLYQAQKVGGLILRRQNFDTGNGNSDRYDLSVRIGPFYPAVQTVHLCSFELGWPSSTVIATRIWHISLFHYSYSLSPIPDPNTLRFVGT